MPLRPAHLLAAAGLAAAGLAAHAAPAEQVVGGIDGVIFVCQPIDAKSVKPGQDLLQRAVEQRRLDLAAIRRSEAYRGAYNAEVNRLLSMPPRERLAACQSAW
ncbi:hypothetical protein [Piscinibacter defluvii]|uniref:hypothetical protein n=1 Tax=Piscinibacter defluvii TaxID=1796922 RepID=UPI000FDD0558|nr:hypothetical protein [Piscinibacter defluvii]